MMGLSRSFALPVGRGSRRAVTPPAFDPCSIRGSEPLFIRSSASESDGGGPFPLKRRLLSAEAKKFHFASAMTGAIFPLMRTRYLSSLCLLIGALTAAAADQA